MIFDCSLHIRAIHLAFFHACTIIYRVAILSVVLWFFYWHFPSALIPYCIGCLGVWVLHCVITKMTTTYLHRHIMRHNDGYYVLVMANFQRLLIVCSCEHPFFLWISLKIARSLAAKNLRIDDSFVRKHNSPSRAEPLSHTAQRLWIPAVVLSFLTLRMYFRPQLTTEKPRYVYLPIMWLVPTDELQCLNWISTNASA